MAASPAASVIATTATANDVTGRTGSRRPRPSRGGCGADGSRSIFERRRRMCTVTVPVSTAASYPQTRPISWSRENTCRGFDARKKRRSNSFAVSRSSEPSRSTSRVRGSIVSPSNASRVGRRPRGRGAPENRLHAHRELAGRERLRDVVVCAELEPHDPVGLVAAGGEHDHRQVAARADPAAEREAVGARQHHVEDDELRLAPLDQLARRVAVAGDERLEPVPAQIPDDDVADDRLVVDHEDGGHGRIVAHGRPVPREFTDRSDLVRDDQ